MIERKALKTLGEWKCRSRGQSALLIDGARHVGKTTLAVEFGRTHYRSCLLIGFSKLPWAVADCFETLRTDLDKFFQFLSIYYDVRLYERESLIIFDEVQCFPMARSFIKHLVADGRYDYIETGSWISIPKNVKNIVIPSEEDALRLNPLEFDEFLAATGNELLAEMIEDNFRKQEPLPEVLHKRAMAAFREYMLVGGMPRVVEIYARTLSFDKADQEKRRILRSYLKEIDCLSKVERNKVASVFNEIPVQLSRCEKRFQLSVISKSARMRSYEKAFHWLVDGRIINPCFAADLDSGLQPDRKTTSSKCYMADTGLLTTLSRMMRVADKSVYRSVFLGDVGVHDAMLLENVLAQTLTTKDESLLFYSQSGQIKNQERMKIDFLIRRPLGESDGELRVSPIEVKASTRLRTMSLDRFAERFQEKVGCEYVVYPGQLKREGKRLYVPFYMAHCL